MINRFQFTSEELAPFVLNFTLVSCILLFNYLKGYREFWSPLTIVAIIFGYYCVLGPYQAVSSGETYDRLRNMRPYYLSAFWGAFIALLSFCLGYLVRGKSKVGGLLPAFSDEALLYYGKRLFLVGFTLFTISTGGNVGKLVNPLDAEYVQQQGGSFANYFGLALNFVIPAITLLFFYLLKTRQGLMWFALSFLVSLGIFMTLGFRYRIVLLLMSMAIVYYYGFMKRRPNPVIVGAALIGFIIFMGIINESRQYGAGLNTKALGKQNTEDFYKSGLRESLIFQTSGAIIDIVPEKYPHAGFAPLISAILFPIPSAILKDKNSAQYLFASLDAIYGKRVSKGAAMMAYGEYYLAFGWAGVVIGFAMMGWFSRNLWNWFWANQHNSMALVVYAVTVTYLYVVISRGYLPQVLMLFVFSVLPIYVVLRLARKRFTSQPSRAF